MQSQFLALSPGGSQFANSSSHPSINTQLMAHTPTTASMIAAMGDPFGAASVHSHHNASSAFAFEPLSFSSHMDTSVVGASAFDFGTGGHGMAMDVTSSSSTSHTIQTAGSTPGSTGGAGDSEMSSPAHAGDGGLVKVEGTA